MLFEDRTKSCQQEEMLRTQARILECMAEGVVVCNHDGIIFFTNPAFDAMFGYTEGELLGKHVNILNNKSSEENELLHKELVERLTTEKYWYGELENRRKDGSVFYTSARMSTLDVSGNKSWISVQEDITESKDLERMKVEMISSVSHEMRTPLTALRGYLQFILENKVNEEQLKDYLNIMLNETERLYDYIGNFLEMQRMRENKISYCFKAVSVVDILNEVAALFANASNKHQIFIDTPSELPLIYGDEACLHQVVNNLLSNAIKYSPDGGQIIIGAKQENNNAIVWVKDEGIGIPPEALNKVFDRFFRVKHQVRNLTNGTGLGLALVREIVHAHGGQVWVDSILGKGSTFYISLPVLNDNLGYLGN